MNVNVYVCPRCGNVRMKNASNDAGGWPYCSGVPTSDDLALHTAQRMTRAGTTTLNMNDVLGAHVQPSTERPITGR